MPDWLNLISSAVTFERAGVFKAWRFYKFPSAVLFSNDVCAEDAKGTHNSHRLGYGTPMNSGNMKLP